MLQFVMLLLAPRCVLARPWTTVSAPHSFRNYDSSRNSADCVEAGAFPWHFKLIYMGCLVFKKWGISVSIAPAACGHALSKGFRQELMAMREPKRARTDASAAASTPVIATNSQERGNHYVARGRTTIVPGKSQLGMPGVMYHVRLHRLHLDARLLFHVL